MEIFALKSRVTTYYKRHGLRATAQRAGIALRRVLFSNRQIVFYCDLANHTTPPEDLPSFLRIERKRSYAELDPRELHEITDFWNSELARQRIEERFSRGASLWLIRSELSLAGYVWTLQGGTISPYYFPLGDKDAQFFDLFLFPRFRGRGIDWILFNHVLHALAAEGGARAFAETGEWNRASVSSHRMARFHRLGHVRKITIFGCTMIWWDKNKADRSVDHERARLTSTDRPSRRSASHSILRSG